MLAALVCVRDVLTHCADGAAHRRQVGVCVRERETCVYVRTYCLAQTNHKIVSFSYLSENTAKKQQQHMRTYVSGVATAVAPSLLRLGQPLECRGVCVCVHARV